MTESGVPGPAEERALAAGLEPWPEAGDGAVAVRFAPGASSFHRVASVVLGLLAVAGVVLLPGVAASGWAVLLVVMMVIAVAVSAVNFHLLARFGSTAPALVIRRDRLQVLVPFNRCEVDLAAVEYVSALSRDIVLVAPGGISQAPSAPGRARRAVISNVRSFTLDRKLLADLLTERAQAARGARDAD